MKLKKGDKVRVMVGKDRGKEGAVEKVWPKLGKIAVAGVNIYKRHSKSGSAGQKGGIRDFIRPLDAAKVALICPKCHKITRVSKKRICRKCQEKL